MAEPTWISGARPGAASGPMASLALGRKSHKKRPSLPSTVKQARPTRKANAPKSITDVRTLLLLRFVSISPVQHERVARPDCCSLALRFSCRQAQGAKWHIALQDQRVLMDYSTCANPCANFWCPSFCGAEASVVPAQHCHACNEFNAGDTSFVGSIGSDTKMVTSHTDSGI